LAESAIDSRCHVEYINTGKTGFSTRLSSSLIPVARAAGHRHAATYFGEYMGPRVIAVQHRIHWEDGPATIAEVEQLLRPLSIPPRSLLVFPEMFATGFSMNVAAAAEDSGGVAHRFLQNLALRHACTTVGGVVRQGTGGLGRNEAVAFGPQGAELARYCKNRLFSHAGEHRYYEAGRGVVTFEWEGFVVCPLICYDLRFPELFRTAAHRGATLFVVIANWPVQRASHWSSLLIARAIENQAFVVGVNRSGHDPHNEYAGGSLVVDPFGEAVAATGSEPCVVESCLDLDSLHRWRARFPALRDMEQPCER